MIENKVIITDGQWRKALSATRALGRSGVKVTVTGDTHFTTSFFSKYCKRRLKIPNAKNNSNLFIEGLLKEISSIKYDALIPMEIDSVKTCVKHRNKIEKYTNLPFPNEKSLLIADNKEKTIKIAQELNIPTPKTYFISDLDQVYKISKGVDFPLIIKPRISSGSHGLKKVFNKKELIDNYKIIHRSYSYPLIQECIPKEGRGHGCGFLFSRENKLLAAFAYRRLREYPVNGGPSTLRESIENPELIEMGVSLLKKIGWHGVAMVEFKLDPRDNKLKLMEINPRFWGSLELPIISGVNFPVLLYKYAVGEKFKPVFKYKVGMRCRWFLPGDILHFISNPDRFKISPSFFKFFDKKTKYDILSLDDPGGTMGRILSMSYSILNPKMWKYVKR